ncbi:peptidylprolyl isomerase [Bartonella sp. F02]|uniref:peptidylprolyl isomerase n=1 Tax=Bartonella sp. F02 TaxID=2967262 RepID=UPI0022A9B642|nr:peptidylprolyl isomerase [Bartonella sp. F02]MCZ2328582.1 peptidyl-prolyl cis-trans isomerase [Bartonella sp. F02]
MLDIIRNTTNSWIVRTFLIILLLCFAILWGIPQLNVKDDKNLLTAGKSTITVDMYQLAFADKSINLAFDSLGRMFTPDEMQQYRIPAFVFNQLQQDVLLDEQARKMKIHLSKDALARAIGTDSIFQQNGIFNRNILLNYLQQLRVNENSFLDYYSKREKRNLLISATLSDMKLPNLFYKILAMYQEETRTADYLVLNLKEKTIADPDSKTLQKWFDTHQDNFKTPEYRTVSLLPIELSELIKRKNISIDEAKAYYTQNSSRFTIPEKRIIEKLQFSTHEDADNAAKKIANGLSFDDLVKEENKTLNDITEGPLSEHEFPTYLASEIFELQQGQVSSVINDLQGPVIVRVTHIIPSSLIPFEKAEKDIRQTLAKNYATTDLRNNYMEIENARFEGASLKELADQYKLPLRQITVDKTGKTIDGITLTDLPQKDILLDNIYKADKEDELDPLSLQEGYLWYQIDAIIPTRNKTLEEVKQDAVIEWKNAEIQRLLDKKAQDALEQLKEGKSFDLLARELGIIKQKTQALRRQDSSEIFGFNGVKALFSDSKNHYGVIKSPAGTDRIIYKVTSSIIPTNITAHTILPAIRNNMDQMIRGDLKLEMLQIANNENPLKINRSNYDQLFNITQ